MGNRHSQLRDREVLAQAALCPCFFALQNAHFLGGQWVELSIPAWLATRLVGCIHRPQPTRHLHHGTERMWDHALLLRNPAEVRARNGAYVGPRNY